MDAIKAWFDKYTAEVEAILATIYNFVMAIFNKEVAPEFEALGK